MNDLAERALHGLDVGRRFVLARPLPWLAALGFVVSALVVVVGGRIGAAPAALPLDSWLGLLPHAGYRVVGVLPGLLMIGGIAALALLWLLLLGLSARRSVRLRALWVTAGCWALPFVIGPPLLSTDVYSSAARGLLARADLSPYHHAPTALADAQLVNAIDPTWRGTPATGGPLSVALEHLLATVAAGNPLATVLLLRAVAIASVIAAGRIAVELAGTHRRLALATTIANPAVLLYIVPSAHLEGAVAALLLGVFLLAGRRRWDAAIVLSCLAAGLRPVALVAVLIAIAAHAAGVRRASAWRVAARDVGIAALTLIAGTLVVPYGLGWAGNLGTVTREHTPFAPATLVSDLISTIVSPASYDDLAVGGRLAAVLAAITVVAYLLVTVQHRALERSVGYALLAAALLAPVLFPWFLLPGLLCLAATARGNLRDWVIALSMAACAVVPAGFTRRTGEVVTLCAFAAVLAWLVPRLVGHQRRRSGVSARAAS